MLSRRSLLALLPATAALAAAGARAATEAPRQLRIGTQKGEPVLVAARKNRSLETLLEPLGVEVSYIEFQFGPPILEAMRVGSIDIGATGDAPPVFAQAAHSDLVYFATRPDNGDSSAILLPPGSTLQTLHDLKGKRVAFGRGSSAHNLTIAALEKAGLSYGDIQPITLSPADATAAFEHGDIDAWTIWDPYYALTEARPVVRVLASTKDITPQNSFYLATRDFATRYGDVLTKVVQELGRVGAWGDAHRDEVARMLTAQTGVPLDAWTRSVNRASFRTVPIDDRVLGEQQQVADRFYGLRIIPAPVNVHDYAWHASS